MLLQLSCATQVKKTEIVYVIPPLDFPEFPVLESIKICEDEEYSYVPSDYLIEMAKYKNKIESLEEYINNAREKLKGEE